MAIERTDLVGSPYAPRGKHEQPVQMGDVIRAVDVTEECLAQIGFRIHAPNRHVLLLYTRSESGIYVFIVTWDGDDPSADETCSGASVREFRSQRQWYDDHAMTVKRKLFPLCQDCHNAVALLGRYAPS